MFALWPAEFRHIVNASWAASCTVPAAMFSPAPPGEPQFCARVDGARPSESVCEKYALSPRSCAIHAAARLRFVDACSGATPFSAR